MKTFSKVPSELIQFLFPWARKALVHKPSLSEADPPLENKKTKQFKE